MNLNIYDNIESQIYTIRTTQVMLDSDLAVLYNVETKVLNQAVKRNIDRFPETFRFQLTYDEIEILRSQYATSEEEVKSSKSQIVTLNKGRGHNVKYLPYAFTEQGVAMLSAVLRSDVAVQVSIQIMQAFVSMRKFLLNNASVFQRLDQVEMKQLKTDEKIEQIFKALEAGQPKPDKGIFFDGQVFDAYVFVAELIKKAKTDIILIDNYVDESVLMLLSKRDKKASATIYTKSITKTLQLDIEKHNSQYTTIAIKELTVSHDRFLIIDRKELYHLGASLKDLGKKWFAFSKLDGNILEMMLEQIKKAVA
jgi:hypothetical protein